MDRRNRQRLTKHHCRGQMACAPRDEGDGRPYILRRTFSFSHGPFRSRDKIKFIRTGDAATVFPFFYPPTPWILVTEYGPDQI
jgi:hypothetical protein